MVDFSGCGYYPKALVFIFLDVAEVQYFFLSLCHDGCGGISAQLAQAIDPVMPQSPQPRWTAV